MNISYKQDTLGYLDLTFGPNWDYIPITRNYIENFLLINIDEKESINRIAMAASELLENAVKYSTKDGVRIIINKEDERKEIELFVLNYADKTLALEHIKRIETMNAAEPLQYYIEKMKESVIRKDGKAGLGLARINHEANAKISGKYHDSTGTLEVKAVFSLPSK